MTRIVALDSTYSQKDSIFEIGYYVNPDLTSCIHDFKETQYERGISDELYEEFVTRTKKGTTMYLTWGGPEYIALTGHKNNHLLGNSNVIDLERIVDAVFPVSSLVRVSRMLGVEHIKYRCPSKDAEKIKRVYAKLRRLDLCVKYSIDWVRVMDSMDSRRNIINRELFRKAGLIGLYNYIMANYKFNITHQTLFKRRLKLIKKDNRTLAELKAIEHKTELDYVLIHYRIHNRVLARYDSIPNHMGSKRIDVKDDVQYLLKKLREDKRKILYDSKEYMKMYLTPKSNTIQGRLAK